MSDAMSQSSKQQGNAVRRHFARRFHKYNNMLMHFGIATVQRSSRYNTNRAPAQSSKQGGNGANQTRKSSARTNRTSRDGKRWSSLTGLGIPKMPFRQIPAPTLLLAAAALWSSQWLVGVSASFSMVVEHGVEECFVIRAPKEKSVIR